MHDVQKPSRWKSRLAQRLINNLINKKVRFVRLVRGLMSAFAPWKVLTYQEVGWLGDKDSNLD